MKKPFYGDLGDLAESERIRIIGHQVVAHKKVVAFIVDDDAKGDHYLQQLNSAFPGGIQVLYRGPGPVENTTMIKVGPIAGASA